MDILPYGYYSLKKELLSVIWTRANLTMEGPGYNLGKGLGYSEMQVFTNPVIVAYCDIDLSNSSRWKHLRSDKAIATGWRNTIHISNKQTLILRFVRHDWMEYLVEDMRVDFITESQEPKN